VRVHPCTATEARPLSGEPAGWLGRTGHLAASLHRPGPPPESPDRWLAAASSGTSGWPLAAVSSQPGTGEASPGARDAARAGPELRPLLPCAGSAAGLPSAAAAPA